MSSRQHKAQQGMSLIELMIGMVLGLIVVSAVFNMYTGSQRSSRFSEGLQAMQENGRYGVSVLQRGLRLAGFSPNARLAPLDIANGDANTIIVQAMQPFDCNGQSTAGTAGLAVNTYRLDAASQQITCQGNSAAATAMPVVEGVEAMRILYGLDDDGDDVPERYVPHAAGIDPGTVSALRFALLVNSGMPIRTRATNETHVLLDTEVASNDRVARNVFTGSVKLRNRN